jgi:hypothetical protein
MANRRTWIVVGALLAAGVALPVGWYLFSPLFINRAVDEALPTAAFTFVPAEATAAMEKAMAEPTQAMAEAMPAGDMATMTILAQGEFYDIAHEGRGRATVYQLADGSRVLRFEDFEVLNGPDLHVWLVPVDPVPDTVGVEIPGYVDLGKLKGNIGNQNYDLPADLDLAQFKSVVIWCQPFRVPFSAAPLRAL